MATSLAIQTTHFVDGLRGTQNLETKATRTAGNGTDPAIDQPPPSDDQLNPAELANDLDDILPGWRDAPTPGELAALLAAQRPMVAVRWADQLCKYANALADVLATHNGEMPPHLHHLDRAMQALQPVLASLCTQRSVPHYLNAGMKTVCAFLSAGLPLHEELTKAVIVAAGKGLHPPPRLEAVVDFFTLLINQPDGLGPPLSDALLEALPNLLEQAERQQPKLKVAIKKALPDSLKRSRKKASVAPATAEMQEECAIKATAKGARLASEQGGLFADNEHAKQLRKQVARRILGEFGAAALEYAQLPTDPGQFTLMHVAAALHFVKALLDDPQPADLEGELVDKVLPTLLKLTLEYRFDEVGSHAIAQALTAVAELATLAKPSLKPSLMEAAQNLMKQAFLLDGSDAPDRKLFRKAVSRLVALEIVTVAELRGLGTSFAKQLDESSAHRWLSSPIRPCTHQMWLLATLLKHDLVDDKKIAKKAASFLAVRLEWAVAVLKDAPPRDPRTDSDTLALVQAALEVAWGVRLLAPVIAGHLRTWAYELSRMLVNSVPLVMSAFNDGKQKQAQDQGKQDKGRGNQEQGSGNQDKGDGKKGEELHDEPAVNEPAKKRGVPSRYGAARLRP